MLERLVNDRGADFPDKRDEWVSYLYFLREYAEPDGTVPSSFDGLIQDTFAGPRGVIGQRGGARGPLPGFAIVSSIVLVPTCAARVDPADREPVAAVRERGGVERVLDPVDVLAGPVRLVLIRARPRRRSRRGR